jgi:hypothetical protein
VKRPVLISVAVALVGLACALGIPAALRVSPAAATVNGVQISQAALNSDLSTISSNPYARCMVEAQDGSSVPVANGVGDSSVSAAFAGYELSTLVVQQLIGQDLARRHDTVQPAELAAARADTVGQVQQNNCGLTGDQLVARIPKAFMDEQVSVVADEEQLAAAIGHLDISRAGLMTYYQSNQAQFDEACLNLIVTQSQSTAQTIDDAIAGGATFATESQATGVDPESPAGGELRCALPAEINGAFGQTITSSIYAGAKGQLLVPLEWDQQGATTPSWIVVQIRDRQTAAFSGVQSYIREEVVSAQSTSTDAEVQRLVGGSQVTIDPRYGTWSAQHGVSPPSTPLTKVLLAPSADEPASSSPLVSLGG